jgi:hypothetical protein
MFSSCQASECKQGSFKASLVPAAIVAVIKWTWVLNVATNKFMDRLLEKSFQTVRLSG